MGRLSLFLALFALLLPAQTMKMTVGQLKGFLRSSIELKHPDKQVADYIKKIQVTEKLTERDVEELLGEGLGPKAADALKDKVSASSALPVAHKDPVVAPQPKAEIPPPSSIDQKKIIEEARELALSYSKSLPDFICMQVTRRYYDPSGLEIYHPVDTVAARLSYFEQKENYKLISVNNQYTEMDMEKLGGATSSGEFGSMLKQLFEPDTKAEFWWERYAKLRGRIVYVFGYQVSQAHSQWHVTWQRQLDVVPAYKGLIYIDKIVPQVLRVTLQADNLPPDFPIRAAGSQLDYEFTDISGQQFLLPLRAEVKMREGKMLVKNLVEFRNYRKFGATTDITFDFDDKGPMPEDKEEKATPTQAPPPTPKK